MPIEKVGMWLKATALSAQERKEVPFYFMASDVVSIKGKPDGNSAVAFRLSSRMQGGHEIMTQILVHTPEEVVAAIEDALVLRAVGPVGEPYDPEKAKAQRMEEIEEMGEAMARGAKRGQDKEDRDNWGKPGE